MVLAVPTTYMNESGQAAGPLVRRYGIDDPRRLVVVHDELDLEPGRLKVKDGGGLAGHNGLRSITAHLHTQDYLRIRLGVGKPPGGPERGADWVLSKVPKRHREELDVMVAEAADAVECIATDGRGRGHAAVQRPGLSGRRCSAHRDRRFDGPTAARASPASWCAAIRSPSTTRARTTVDAGYMEPITPIRVTQPLAAGHQEQGVGQHVEAPRRGPPGGSRRRRGRARPPQDGRRCRQR